MKSQTLIAQNPARTSLAASANTAAKWSWPVSTAAWSVIGACTPVNYALPPIARTAWFVALGAMILIPMLTLNVARPLYPVIWIFAGYASIVSVFIATNESTVPGNAFVGAQLVLILGFGPFILTKLASNDPKFAERFFAGFIAGQTFSSFVGFLQAAGYVRVTRVDVADFYGRYPGLADHQNSLGFLAAVAAMLCFQQLNRARTAWLYLGAACVNIVGVIVSGSFTGVMALGLGLSAALLCSRRRRKFFVVFFTSIASVLAIWFGVVTTGASSYLPSFASRYLQVTGQTSGPSSLEQRQTSWDRVFNADFVDLIYGRGLSVSAGASDETTTRFVHNTVLRAWLQGGIYLGIAFALIVAGILALIIRAIRRKEYGTEAGVLMAFLAYGAVSPVIEQRQYWLPVLVAWSSISAAALRSSTGEKIGGSGLRSAAPIRSAGHP